MSFGKKIWRIRRCSFPIIDYFRNKLLEREHSVTWYCTLLLQTNQLMDQSSELLYTPLRATSSILLNKPLIDCFASSKQSIPHFFQVSTGFVCFRNTVSFNIFHHLSNTFEPYPSLGNPMFCSPLLCHLLQRYLQLHQFILARPSGRAV